MRAGESVSRQCPKLFTFADVRELVSAHHGRVELQSELGRGTTARVVLPSGAIVPWPALRPAPAWA